MSEAYWLCPVTLSGPSHRLTYYAKYSCHVSLARLVFDVVFAVVFDQMLEVEIYT